MRLVALQHRDIGRLRRRILSQQREQLRFLEQQVERLGGLRQLLFDPGERSVQPRGTLAFGRQINPASGLEGSA